MKAESLLKKYTFWHDVDNQFSKNIDFSKTSISETADKSTQTNYTKSDKNADLHEYIFKFYAYNEILSSQREKSNGILDKDDLKIYKEYKDFLNDFSKRIFSFILYASIAESRHSYFIGESEDSYDEDYNNDLVSAFVKSEINDLEKSKVVKEFFEHVEEDNSEKDAEKIIKDYKSNKKKLESDLSEYIWEYWDIPYSIPDKFEVPFKKEYYTSDAHKKSIIGKFEDLLKDVDKDRFFEFVKFIQEVNKIGSDGDGGSLQRSLVSRKLIQNSNIKDFSTDEIFHYLSIFFLKGFEGGYGNEPWSEIAKHALTFSKGEINAEMFIDRALSLEHNNGQMFNKNYLFNDDISTGDFNLLYLNHHGHTTNYYFNVSINDFILHLQNSSSVLACSHFLNKEWNDLTHNLNFKELNKTFADFNKDHSHSLKNNFESFKDFAEQIQSLPKMLELAKKIDYSIPKFNFANMALIAAEKKRKDYIVTSIENTPALNNILSDIVNEKYISNSKYEINLDKYKTKPEFHLHNLNSINAKTLTKESIGGKAKGLTDLINLGFAVPKAMVFDTETCLSYLANKKNFQKEYKTVNRQISKYLVDEQNLPILVSVRSGAPISMPGMMDSILNVGIDDNTYPKLCSIYGKTMINECVTSFMHQFCSSKLGLDIKFPKNIDKALDKFTEILIKNDIPCDRRNLFPLNKEAQIKLSVEAVFDSWNSPRAIAWRNEKNIPHDMGTAATVQKMVFGNKNENSLTCVIFSRDCITGKPEIMGEYLMQAQGEDLVSGKKTPLPIKDLMNTHPEVYKQIEYIAKTLEEEKKAIQDIEITVEDNKVYVLQMRNAVVSPEAQLSLAKELNLSLLETVHPKNLVGEMKIDTQLNPDYKGLAASPGLISGIVVKNLDDVEKYKSKNKPLIFFSNQALPEHAPIMIATDAFVTEFGGSTSHAAILARSMGKPCVVGIGKESIKSGVVMTLDAINGYIWKKELPIVINQDNAIELSEKVLKEKKVVITEETRPTSFVLDNWTTSLSNFEIKETKNKKHSMFLNIAQKAALSLKMEHHKKMKKG